METAPTAGAAAGGSTKRHRVVAFWGSARAASCNAGLVRSVVASAERVSPCLSITLLDVSAWPLFNDDLITAGRVPEPVLAGLRLVHDADAVLISTPEYNFGLAPQTTNAVAWLSKRILPEHVAAPLARKPCGLLSAGGGLGGERAQLQARSSFTVFLDMPTMASPRLAVRIFTDPRPFDAASGDLVGEAERRKVDEYVLAFQDWTAKHVAMSKMASVADVS